MTDTPIYLFDEDILEIITKGISHGKAQSACIWEIVRLEKKDYLVNDTPEIQKEWNARYHEIDAFIAQKGLRVPEISPLIDGFKKDVRRLLGLA
jgi:hypothetical protein